MATKIDLLPGYVGMRRWFSRLFLVAVVLIGSLGTILWLVWFQTDLRFHKLETDLDTYTRVASKAKAAEDAATKADADAAPIKTSVDFMVAASQTGAQRAALIRLIKLYIYPEALISSIDVSNGTDCSITGAVAQPNDYYSAVLDLRQGASSNGGLVFQDEPKFNGIPGFGSQTGPIASSVDEQKAMFMSGDQHPLLLPLPIKASAKLKDPVSIPSDSGAIGGAAAGAAGPGMPGAPGAVPPTTAPASKTGG